MSLCLICASLTLSLKFKASSELDIVSHSSSLSGIGYLRSSKDKRRFVIVDVARSFPAQPTYLVQSQDESVEFFDANPSAGG